MRYIHLYPRLQNVNWRRHCGNRRAGDVAAHESRS
jgi:hypothetical protein